MFDLVQLIEDGFDDLYVDDESLVEVDTASD